MRFAFCTKEALTLPPIAKQTRKKVLDLLPNAEENRAQLQGLVDATMGKLTGLTAKWEERRLALVANYRALRVRLNERGGRGRGGRGRETDRETDRERDRETERETEKAEST